MSINQVIIYIMLVFMVVGIVDKLIFKNKFGYGEQFEEGIKAMGTLALSMVGIMCLAPVLGDLLAPIVQPVYGLIGADGAMFAGSILAIDMGGWPLAEAIAQTSDIARLSGIYVGSMMGATIVFSIPVSLGIIDKKDMPYLAKGMLAGFIAIPFGAFISACIDGIPVMMTIINLIPSLVLSILFAIGLALIPNGMMKGFDVFAKFITIVITLALGLAIITELAGVPVTPEMITAEVANTKYIPFISFTKDMAPITDQLATCGIIAITLAGAYPMVHFITTVLAKPLGSVGKLIGINDVAVAGMIACLANNIPTFDMLKNMDKKGKVLAVAFSVCAAFALGDHLGYTAGAAPDAIFPMIVGKIAGGVIGVIIAVIMFGKSFKAEAASDNAAQTA